MSKHPALESAIEALKNLLGSRATDAPAVLEHHSHGESYHQPAAPDVVCFPVNTQEVIQIVDISERFQLPLIPFGAGTSLEGHVHAIRGGISVDLREMNRILRVSPKISMPPSKRASRDCSLRRHCATPVSCSRSTPVPTRRSAAWRQPGPPARPRFATERCARTYSGVTAVLADGRVIATGGRARKSAAGYDLTRLLVGSEGTLGIITEVTVDSIPCPRRSRRRSAHSSGFRRGGYGDHDNSAGDPGGPHRAAGRSADGCDQPFSRSSVPGCADAHLRISWRQRAARRASGPERCRRRDQRMGARLRVGETARGPGERLWQARHNAHSRASRCAPAARSGRRTSACRFRALPNASSKPKRDHEGAPFPICLVGHAGDGNFHVMPRGRRSRPGCGRGPRPGRRRGRSSRGGRAARCSARASSIRGSGRRWRPRRLPPSGPVTRIASPGRAPRASHRAGRPRRPARPSHRPRAARPRRSCRRRPGRRRTDRPGRHAGVKSSRATAAAPSRGRATATNAATGTPAIAAMSDRFTPIALYADGLGPASRAGNGGRPSACRSSPAGPRPRRPRGSRNRRRCPRVHPGWPGDRASRSQRDQARTRRAAGFRPSHPRHGCPRRPGRPGRPARPRRSRSGPASRDRLVERDRAGAEAEVGGQTLGPGPPRPRRRSCRRGRGTGTPATPRGAATPTTVLPKRVERVEGPLAGQAEVGPVERARPGPRPG